MAEPPGIHPTSRDIEDQRVDVVTELLVDKVREDLNDSSSCKGNPLG